MITIHLVWILIKTQTLRHTSHGSQGTDSEVSGKDSMNISKTIFKSQDIVAEWWRTYNTKTKYVEGGTKLTLLHLHSHDLIYTTVQSLDVFLFLKTRETRKKDNLKSQQKNYIGSFKIQG